MEITVFFLVLQHCSIEEARWMPNRAGSIFISVSLVLIRHILEHHSLYILFIAILFSLMINMGLNVDVACTP